MSDLHPPSLKALHQALTQVSPHVRWSEPEQPVGVAAHLTLRQTPPVTVAFDYSVVPKLVGSADGYEHIQMFVELATDADIRRVPQLLWLLNKINTVLPVGCFGVFDTLHVLYWKQMVCLDTTIDPAQSARTLMTQTRLARQVIGDFRGTLHEVLGGRPAVEALLDNTWAPVLLPNA